MKLKSRWNAKSVCTCNQDYKNSLKYMQGIFVLYLEGNLFSNNQIMNKLNKKGTILYVLQVRRFSDVIYLSPSQYIYICICTYILGVLEIVVRAAYYYKVRLSSFWSYLVGINDKSSRGRFNNN